jgi:serine/threonine protein kinase/tetratricopeptide (TPR) repeat protein
MKCPSCGKDVSGSTSFCGFCGAVLVAREDAWNIPTQTQPHSVREMKRGSVFSGRFEIIEQLGQGGMGSVFRAFDISTKEEVTLKILRPEISHDREAIAHYKTEWNSAAKIAHKNVCKMYDFGQESDLNYITMEYVSGQDLKRLIRQTGHLALATAVGVAKQVCRGLAAAHRSGVIHRDLKPGNIMIDREGCVRIMDFGMARSHPSDGEAGREIVNADPQYMSPELAEGAEVDLRTDIYSLGIILYEILAGSVPFKGDSSLGLAIKHKTEEPPSPSESNPLVPEELERVIFKCLEKDREKRYSTADEVYDDLDRIGIEISRLDRSGSGQKTPNSLPGMNITKPSRVFLWTVLMILVVAVFSLLIFKKRDLTASDTGMQMLVVLPFENLGLPDDEYFSDGLSEEIMSRLAALKELGVISRTSAFHYKNTDKTVKKIGEELKVNFVLEGTVRWNRGPDGKGRVRVTAQLIRVADDTHLWADTYERQIDDIFSVQGEIADQVIKQLDITILEPERSAVRENPTNNLEAFDAYLRAKTAAMKAYIGQDRYEYEKAIRFLNTAVSLDPNFLQAYLTLFNDHMSLYRVGLDRTEERVTAIQETLNRLEELAPDSPDVQMTQGLYFMWIVRDYDRALEIFDAVQRVRPNLSPSYRALIKKLRGDWEGCIADFERAFRLNPLSSDLAHILGRCYAWIYDYQKAEEWFTRALSIFPDLYYSKLGMARLPLLARGDLQESRILLEALPQHVLTEYNLFELGMLERNYEDVLERLLASPFDTLAEAQFYIPKDLALASVYSTMGKTELMRAHADRATVELEKKQRENPGDIRFCAALSLAYAYSGNHEAAVREGERAVALFPLSRDAFEGPRYILNLAKIYTVVGDAAKALDQLEFLFSIPCGNNYSIPLLRLDPAWDSLRGHPRFQRLLTTNVHWGDN